MNTQHLQYIIEIERTRSISQAAENLFIGQPNLSRILHDVEQMLGTPSPSCARPRPSRRWGPSGPWRTGCACASPARPPCWI